MNDRAREVLVKAALDGVPQIRGQLSYYKNGQRGFCTIGLLLHALGVDLSFVCYDIDTHYTALQKEYDISHKEVSEILEANDYQGWDFLTIARTCGQKELQNNG